MAERVSFVPEEEDDDAEDSKYSSTTKSRAASFGASLVGREVSSKQPERPAPKSFAEALNSLVNKEDKEVAAEKARTEPWDDPNSLATAVPQEAAPEEATLQTRELYPHEISRGEVVLDLQSMGVEPIQHEVIVEPTEANEAEPTEEEMPIPDEIAVEAIELDDENEPEAVNPPTARGKSSRSRSSTTAPSRSSSRTTSTTVPPRPLNPGSPGMPPTPPIWPAPPGRNPANPNQPPQNPNVIPAPAGATVEELNEAAYYGERRGLGRGLVTGLLLGGGIEHFRHKRREKRTEKAHKKAQKEQLAVLDHTKAEHAIAEQERTREAYWSAKTAARQERGAQLETERLQDRLAKVEQGVGTAEKVQQMQPEKVVAPARAEITPEQLDIPEDHHVETSAWHAIEVDKHGKAVQESNIQYGHEYYRERSKEQAPKDDVQGAAGEVALVAAALSDEAGSQAAKDIDAKISAAMPSHEHKHTHTASEQSTDIKQTIIQMVGPPKTALGTLIWFSLLVMLVILGILLIS